MRSDTGAGIFIVFIGCLIIASAYGWVENIVKICGSDFSHITGILVIRIIGAFIAPLGAILGFM